MTAAMIAKASDEQRTANTALADAELTFPLAANTTYRIRGNVLWRAGATCDFKFGWSVGGASLVHAAGIVHAGSQTEATDTEIATTNTRGAVLTVDALTAGTIASASGRGDATTYVDYKSRIYFSIFLTTGSTSGTFSFLFGQNTLHGTEVAEVLAGSSLFYEDVTENDKLQWVVKSINEERTTDGDPLAVDSDLVIALEPNTDYWFEGLVLGYTYMDFGARLYGGLRFDGDLDPAARTTDWLYYRIPCRIPPLLDSQPGTSIYYAGDGLSGTTQLFNSDSNSTNRVGAFYYEGHISVGATGGDLSFWWLHDDNGASGVPFSRVLASSFLKVEKLNPCVLSL